MIGSIIVAALVLAALVYVIRPLARATRIPDSTPTELDAANARKQTALSAIVELEEERELGKLGEADFESLRAQYEAEALEALKDLDAVEQVTEPQDPLEAEIAAVRKQLQCPNCGSLRTSGGKCPVCDDS